MPVINNSFFSDLLDWTIGLVSPRHLPFEELLNGSAVEVYLHHNGCSYFDRFALENGSMNDSALAQATTFKEIVKRLGPKENVVVSFSPDHYLELAESLPLISMERACAVLSLSNLKTLPLKPEEYVWGWFAKFRRRSTIETCRVILKRKTLAEIEEEIAAKGAQLIGVTFRDKLGKALPIALSPDGSSYASHRFSAWSKFLAWIILATLATGLLSYLTAVAHQNRELNAIAVANTALGAKAAEFKKRQANFLAERETIAAVMRRKYGQSSKSTLFRELSNVLPNDAYLTGMIVDGAKLSIDGAASNPELLLPLLEKSPLFEHVSLSGSISRNPGEALSHFSFTMDVASPDQQSKAQ